MVSFRQDFGLKDISSKRKEFSCILDHPATESTFLHPSYYLSVLKQQWGHVPTDSIALSSDICLWVLSKFPLLFNTHYHARKDKSTQKSAPRTLQEGAQKYQFWIQQGIFSLS